MKIIDTMDFAEGSIDSCPENYTYSTEISKCVSNNVINEITDLILEAGTTVYVKVVGNGNYDSSKYNISSVIGFLLSLINSNII